MVNLQNKIVLITGASSGIGQACARLFAQNGANLILCARRQDRIEHLANDLQTMHGIHCLPIVLDVRDKAKVESALSSLPSEWQKISVLINNAGLALSTDSIQQGSISNWETMIDTNVKGLLYVTRAILPGMLAREEGHIINIGSIAGQECYPNGNVYCATKHAVRALTKSMRMDLLGSPIRVTEIAPGAVETEFSEVRWNDKEKAKAFYEDFNPLYAEDIADAVYFCATRPLHVDIAEMTIMPTAQASASCIYRTGKKLQ
ncbi:SDR family oxidoreductase [Legionella micdadei]|uniref:NADP-dependent L-serine/L-allo-threonine dehydrogenase ydfG n=1 Tax=Legionella micdadei TaxID=451 RepID=A0A098GG04_LEGMI|nr:SDR family oxidoreductase [Legionella micdadei]ARG97527.1 NAD(P)-dependent oxidoreductase [Legionella micdadei]ARH00163.1 NAD(P)-dependent oxidoreductase [Legionella micdadei]KTD27600.1 NADP-dependent L-serine/L-allo-threonine dehydrogenase ydfG [Legionella micdadei]NSL17582.1 SDR family oxidoreductase [Legionella micdadei]CEG60915.1 NADP-dependent L-serine/L-allo-threonine dehydrogenase ydfG [Legionella micdadei]